MRFIIVVLARSLAIGGLRSFDALRHDYEGLLNRGLNVIEEWVEAIDRDRREVRLSSGVTLGYDRLIVAPGIDIRYDSVPGYSIDAQLAMPHAYKGGAQVEVLTARLKAMRPGGVFVMLAPPEPSRCPPGPYERASMAAQLLASTNPTAKIIVLDPKDEFTKKDLFLDGWKRHYPGMIEWTPLSKLGKVEVDPETMELRAGGQTFKADVANVIPAQKAGQIAEAAGLTENGWCPIVPATMQSRMDENIHVLGDAATASAMPKSAFAANSQAKVAANAILGALTGSPVYEPHYANICWSVIADKDCVKIGGTYRRSRRSSSPRRPSSRRWTTPSTFARPTNEKPFPGTRASCRKCSVSRRKQPRSRQGRPARRARTPAGNGASRCVDSGHAMTVIPAASPASAPTGLSSTTTHSLGATPIRCAARR